MNPKTKNQFSPDYSVPPGEILGEKLEEMGMSQKELARRMGRPLKTINEIVKGKAAITAETALQLGKVTGVEASFWNNAEASYREALARDKEAEEQEKQISWLKAFSLTKMVELGWIAACEEKVAYVDELQRFFGVASRRQWDETCLLPAEGAFRHSSKFKSKPGDLRAWMRRGEVLARGIKCGPYDPLSFRDALKEIRRLTAYDFNEAHSEMGRLCAEAGVAVVFVPELPKTHVSGFTRWLSPNKALIQQSARGKRDDHLWFTFFHEAGHILLHPKKKVYVEDGGDQDEQEEEANRFARDFLIPKSEWNWFTAAQAARFRSLIRSDKTVNRTVEKQLKKAVRVFAATAEIAPGIVVGRLQKEGLVEYRCLNDLKIKLEFVRT